MKDKLSEELSKDLNLALTGKSDGTKKVYKSIANNIVDFLGSRDTFDAEGWQKYLNYLGDKGRKKSYRRTSYYVYKKLCQLTGGNTFALPDPPNVERRDKTQTLIDEKRLVDALKVLNELSVKEQIALSLGAFYGFRNSEIGRISPSDFDSNDVFHAPTVKKGLQKAHYIPEKLQQFINEENAEEMKNWISNYKSSYHAVHYKLFYDIFYPLKPDEEKRYGWHTVRRKLVTEFDSIILKWKREERKDERRKIPFEQDEVNRFMRWAESKSMYDTYAQRPDSMSTVKDIETDEIIFEHHPFIEYLD